MMTLAQRIDGVICFSPDPWGEVKRPQQLMSQLARRVPVIYVEAPVSLLSMAKHPREAFAEGSRARWWRAITGRSSELAENIHVVTPLTVVPEHRLSSVVPIETLRNRLRSRARNSAGRRARRAAGHVGVASAATWFGHPVSTSETGLDASDVVAYDCVDRWSDFPGPMADDVWRRQLAADEHELMARADVVFCSAKGLFDSCQSAARGQSVLLPNAADVDHFAPSTRPEPPELSGLARPIIGYVGAIAEWVDVELLRAVALMRPDWSIALVGPVYQGAISGDSTAMEAITDLPNIHILGSRPYDEVPAYLDSFDVAIIPFKVNGLTEDTSPIKVYEYLAAGAPVVSTPLPEVVGLTGVRIASGAADFVTQCEGALAERDDVELAAGRIDVARRNSWEARSTVAWGVMNASSPARFVSPGALQVRPKVLVIATDTPWPMDSGWRIRAFENIRALSDFGEVTLISFAEDPDAGSLAALRAALPHVRVVDPVPHRIHIKERPLRLAQAAAAGLLTGRPYKVAKFRSAEMRRRVLLLHSEERFDVIHAELATFPYADMCRERTSGSRPSVVLDEHNVESHLLLDHCRRGEFGLLTPAVRIECERTLRFETRACSRADLVLTISEEDRTQLASMSRGKTKIVTLAPVVAGADAPLRRRGVRDGTVLFVGQMSWLPNQEAIRWLCDQALLHIREGRPDARVLVVGGGAPADLVDYMTSCGVEPLGYVDDISAVYDQAAVYAAPFLTGGGVRIKLLDAMREGIPIVTTTTGAKGLQVVAGEHLLIGDTPEDFAGCVCRVLSDSSLAHKLAVAAKQYLASHHSREAAGARLHAAYATLPSLVSRAGESASAPEGFRRAEALGAVRQR